MRGVLFCVTHPGPSTPNGRNRFIFVYVIDIIFPLSICNVFLSPIRCGDSRVCRAFCAVFYSDTKARGAVFYSDSRASSAVFYSDTKVSGAVFYSD